MNSADEFERAFSQAKELHATGRLAEAERAYRQLQVPTERREEVLRALVELYVQAQRPGDAIKALKALADLAPDSLSYCSRLASALDAIGQTDTAIEQYRRLLERQPQLAAAHFNLALLLKKNKLFADAVTEYEAAISLGIDGMQQVYSNLGVLYADMRNVEMAAQMYARALEVDPGYVPAMFNLAGLLEESGKRPQAIDYYRQILDITPQHWEALARLAYAQRILPDDESVVASLQQAIAALRDDPSARETLHFALGKALDDLGRYDEAFAAYRIANDTGRLRNRTYDRGTTEQAIEKLMGLFDADWVREPAIDSAQSPIFICGMFRSGSTLTEQILAAHPEVTAGGELDFLPWLLARSFTPFPEGVRNASRMELEQLKTEYLSRVADLFPQAQQVTDKRPDNFVHLGIIRRLFPSAKIVYTKRDALDNCLSIYFQQLGGNLAYATDLANIAHYYRQHERLMSHWIASFGENVFTVDYDQLVATPEPVIRRLLEFLDLPWDDRCLLFQDASNQVRTASVWQVREKLHALSSGRWRNYESYLAEARPLLQADRTNPSH
jgi:tetratricopeptide (TPR) repeat protein